GLKERRNYIKRTATDSSFVSLLAFPSLVEMLPGLLEERLFNLIEEKSAQQIDEFVEKKDLPSALAEKLRQKLTEATTSELAQLRGSLKKRGAEVLKQKLATLI